MRSLRNLILGSMLLAMPALAMGPPIPVTPSTQPSNGPVPAIPEPAALALFVLGVGVVGVSIRRRKG